jgi:AcrR family transcriptional regulator
MARPSNNTDQLLLEAGLELLPETGCRGLSARKLSERAGVNLGMFHYHFKSKDNFIRTLLQQVYEQMFAELNAPPEQGESALHNLRRAVQVLGRFALRHRRLLLRILMDALEGEAAAAEFLRGNLPRHVGLIAQRIAQAQESGEIEPVPVPQLMAFIAGSVSLPILLGGAAQQHAMVAQMTTLPLQSILSEAAMEQRIEFALRGIATQASNRSV